jgi:hypothetical protein
LSAGQGVGSEWRLLAALVLATAACAAPLPPELREAERLRAVLERSLAQAAPERGVAVLLAFGPGVDLDLYVTDPLEETVYFANTPSASGGRLEADLHCGTEAPGDRVEVVRFREPPAGRYRVGVDHPKSCGAGGSTGYALAVVRNGDAELHTGVIRPLEFRLAVLDFRIPADAPGSERSGSAP